MTKTQKEALDEIGFDTSDYRIDEHVTDQKGLKADGTFTKWNQLTAEGKIMVPYYLENTVTAENHQQIHDELVDFAFSVGCIEFVHDPDLTNDRGVYVIGQTSVPADGSAETGCWSYVGMCYSCGRGDYPSVKVGWQALRLPDWCISQGGIHHEFLHAIGLLHEQDRPYFEEHFHANSGGGSMSEANWFDTGHVLEPSSNLMYPGFSLKNGRSYQSHPLLTTTDSVQVEHFLRSGYSKWSIYGQMF